MGDTSTSATMISKLDIGDPLYLHPSDSSTLTIVSIKLKGTENYPVWSNAMRLALEAKNKYGFIDGKCIKPKDDQVLANQWERCNSVVITWLLNSISEELFLGQVFSKLASEVWTDLKESFDKVDGSVVYDLYKRINGISQNGSTVAEYYNRLTTMWKQFDAMVQLPTCSCQAAKDYNDFSTLIKLMQFLMGLDDIYQPVRTNLLTREPFPSVKVAFSIVSREESHRLASNGSKGQNVSFVTKSNQSFDSRKKNTRGPNPNLKCSHCNMLGHTVDRCYEVIGYPPGFRKRSGGQSYRSNVSNNNNKSNSTVGSSNSVGTAMPFTSEQISKLLSLVGESSGGEQAKSNMGGFEIQEGPGDWLPSSVLLGKSPYEIVFGFKPSLMHLRNFGCLCFSTVLNESDKFTYHADKCVLIGYSNVKKGYKLWSLDNKKVLFSRDVKFYEDVYPFKNKHVGNSDFIDKTLNHITFFDCYDTETPEVSQMPDDEEGNNGSHGSSSDDQQPLGPSTSTITSIADQPQQVPTGYEGSSETGFYGEAEDSGTPSDETNLSEGAGLGLRKSTRTSVVPKRFEDYVLSGNAKYSIDKTVNYACLSKENFSFVSLLNKTLEPTCYDEAAKDPRWVEAMNKEMEALFRNNTWTLVDLPPGRKPIGCKWVYKVKYKSSGEIERFKARLVAKGFNQREGLDFGETFSPVVKMVTVRCIIALAVQNDWPMFQLDINNAFLYGTINEDVYMCLPKGYYSPDETRVCKLVKSLYGLKQAPRKWNEKLSSVLVDYGFVQSKCDHSMYVLSRNGVFIVLLVYVDDIVVTGNNIDEVNKIKGVLNLNFQIKDLGKLKYFLGIEVLYNKSGVCLNQRKYCLELLSEFGYLACKPIKTPIEQSYLITAKISKNQSVLKNITGFQKLVGKLIYLSLTRPDISYAVQFLSQFMHSPTDMHLQIALRLLRYLKSGPGCGLLFKKDDKLGLVGFVDSDWAKCLSTRKSVTGYCVYLGGSLVSWKSKKQSTVSRSTGEAEYRAMCSATCEIMWLLNLLREVGVNCELPVKLYCDSKAAISIAANPVFHEKTKHFEVDLHFLREKVGSGIIETVKVDSESQPADGFTKGLSVEQHKVFCEKLGMVNWFSYLNEEGMLKE
ncbi:putative RNA-directed DNA polymerase [Helianthus annuus]|nr:putative RNA-directed DNA polymerase [Helianthus annuus]KAJ0587003.1 putative RNA-directed DNA polymerase [Helianthus annuus]KAJ0925209.1 putative RNA-directed DNA polymerase [Helianthus annuus]